MRDDLLLDGWQISGQSTGFDDAFFESVFFTGNGRMGARGTAAGDTALRPVQRGLFVAGMFDEIKPGITDIVNLPTPIWHALIIGGQQAVLCSKVAHTLDLATGVLTQHYTVQGGGVKVTVCEQRFFSQSNPAVVAQRLTLCAAAPVQLRIESGVLTASCNCPVPDDQVKENSETVQLTRFEQLQAAPQGFAVSFHTVTTAIALQQTLQFSLPQGFTSQLFERQGETCGLQLDGALAAGVPVQLDKLCAVQTGRDNDPLLAPLAPSDTYDSLLAENRQTWQALWASSDIQLSGDDDAQTALRYQMFELLCNCSARDGSVSIGARGLTHTRYKGCYFWDTDLFMMPFFLLARPQAAKSLEEYRLACLPQAKAHAAGMNSAGARYPWMAAYDGTEQCESWDIGASEVHVTADVVYAMHQYAALAGDAEFEARAQEVYIETARFWQSRYSPAPGGGFNLLFCKGPDEYCGITNNNLFTNRMVQYNLQLAIEAAQSLLQSSPARAAALGVTPAEVAGWQALSDGIPLPRDPQTGRLRTDDTFHLLEPVSPAALKTGDSASYHGVCFDRVQRYQVVKQADVLLLMTRLPAAFTQQEKLDAWADFEPLCLHDSTLSFASHALFAAQNGLLGPAMHYFEKAAFLDLREVMGNTGKEGLHLAGMGETWQSVVFGFAGLHMGQNGPTLAPHLPGKWQSLQFCFWWQGRQYEARVNRAQDGSVTSTVLPKQTI